MKLRNILLGGLALSGLAGLYVASIYPYNTDEIEAPKKVSGFEISLNSKFHNKADLDLYLVKLNLEESDSSSIYEVDPDPDNVASVDPRIIRAYLVVNREEGRLNGNSSITANVDYYVDSNNPHMTDEMTGSYQISNIRTSNKREDVEKYIRYSVGELERVISDKESRLYNHLDDLEDF